jgi:hypothetical protein
MNNIKRTRCEICLYEFVKKGKPIKFNTNLSRIRNTFINTCIFILGFIMGYSSIIYLIDRDIVIARAFNIYGSLSQDLRVYYYILYIPIFIIICIYKTSYEILQLSSKLRIRYMKEVLDIKLIIIIIILILYYSLGWRYTNILTDYLFCDIIFIMYLRRHIKSIDKINEELNEYVNYIETV